MDTQKKLRSNKTMEKSDTNVNIQIWNKINQLMTVHPIGNLDTKRIGNSIYIDQSNRNKIGEQDWLAKEDGIDLRKGKSNSLIFPQREAMTHPS